MHLCIKEDRQPPGPLGMALPARGEKGDLLYSVSELYLQYWIWVGAVSNSGYNVDRNY